MEAKLQKVRGIYRCGENVMNYFDLSENVRVPQIGLGTFDLKEESILNGLEAGYRLLDTAWQYRNECEVGKAIKHSGLKREEIFVTTKIWTDFIRSGEIEKAVDDSLNNLQLDSVDLMLIHWPAEGYEAAWEKMIILKEKGLVKHIGVSNFTSQMIENISKSGVLPVINQIESHPYFRNDEIVSFCKGKNIKVQAWCPLGGSYSDLKNNVLFEELSEKYSKSPAQIILRWHIQRNVLIIPRTQNKVRLKDNMNIFDFELLKEDIERINLLDTGRRMGANPDNFNF